MIFRNPPSRYKIISISVIISASVHDIHPYARHASINKVGVTAPLNVGTTVRSESRCALRLQYIDLVVSIELAVEVNFSENCFCTK
jgi:hypothetical protein